MGLEGLGLPTPGEFVGEVKALRASIDGLGKGTTLSIVGLQADIKVFGNKIDDLVRAVNKADATNRELLEVLRKNAEHMGKLANTLG